MKMSPRILLREKTQLSYHNEKAKAREYLKQTFLSKHDLNKKNAIQ
jgi:hypothetical protein